MDFRSNEEQFLTRSTRCDNALIQNKKKKKKKKEKKKKKKEGIRLEKRSVFVKTKNKINLVAISARLYVFDVAWDPWNVSTVFP